MSRLSSLTIFFPCLNDGKTLPELIAKAYTVAPKVAREFEVIIIENGSTDETPQVLNTLTKQYPGLRVVRFKKLLGYGRALKEGFSRSTKDWVFYTDADGQYDPLELRKLADNVTDTTDVVNGYKLKRADAWHRGIAGSLYNWILQKRYHPPIRDVDCDFRLIRRSLIKKITLESRSGTICLELVLKLKQAGARFAEVGVSHFSRAFGSSEFFRWPQLLQMLRDYKRLVLPT